MDTKQTTVKPALRDGELQFVVVVNGIAAQAHSTLKAALCALALALAVSACATCERHPAVCGAAVAITATSLVLSAHHHTVDHTHDVTIQPVHCGAVSCQ